MYLAWFDADRKKSVATKIAEAHERYVAKFGRAPLVCLVNPEDAIPDAAIALRPLSTIGRNCFWIGTDEEIEPDVPTLQIEQQVAPAPKRRARKQIATPGVTPQSQQTSVPETAPVEALTTAKAIKPRRTRKAQPAAKIAKAPVVPPTPVATAPPAPVPTRRRARRERPAA